MGMMAGMGRGLLGAVALPLSGALGLVSGVAARIGSSTGVLQQPCLRRAPSRERLSAFCSGGMPPFWWILKILAPNEAKTSLFRGGGPASCGEPL